MAGTRRVLMTQETVSAKVDEETKQWVEERAEALGVQKSEVLRRAIDNDRNVVEAMPDNDNETTPSAAVEEIEEEDVGLHDEEQSDEEPTEDDEDGTGMAEAVGVGVALAALRKVL